MSGQTQPPLFTTPAEMLAWCGRSRVAVCLQRRPLCLPGRRVLGEWDPLLRRIVLYDERRSDRALVHTFLHEAGHAAGLDEARAAAFARGQMDVLADPSVGALARELRGLAARSGDCI